MSNLRLSYLQKVAGRYLYRPSPHPKKWGGGGCIPHPPPPGFTPVPPYLHVPLTCIIGIGSPAILSPAIMLHNVCFILHLYLHRWCQEKNTCTGKSTKIESQNTFECERAERASDFFFCFLLLLLIVLQ